MTKQRLMSDNMTTNNNLKIKLLSNRRNFEINSFNEKIQHCTDLDQNTVQYLSINKTLEIYDKIEESGHGNFYSGRISEKEFDLFIENIKLNENKIECFVLLFHFIFIGALKLNIFDFFNNAKGLLKIDKDTIFATDDSASNLIMIDYDAAPVEDGGGYEIVFWGKQWIVEDFFDLPRKG